MARLRIYGGDGPPGGTVGVMAVTEPLQRLRQAMATFVGDPYLLTVTGEHGPHCGAVEVTCSDEDLVIAAPGSHSATDARERPQVSLLWPPAERGGYALIVDGTAVAKGTELVVRPTRAVLHRRGAPADPPLSACSSDCVPILP